MKSYQNVHKKPRNYRLLGGIAFASILLPVIGLDIIYPMNPVLRSDWLKIIPFYEGIIKSVHSSLERAMVLELIQGKMQPAQVKAYIFLVISILPISFISASLITRLKKKVVKNNYRDVFIKFEMVTNVDTDDEMVPEIKRVTDKNFIIDKCYSEKSLYKFLNGLLETLYQRKLIPFQQGEVVSTGYPGTWEIRRVDGHDNDERAFFTEAGWYRKEIENGIEKMRWPSIEVDTEFVNLHLNGIKLTEAKIKRSIELFEKYLEKKLDNQFFITETKVQFKPLKDLDRLFTKGDVSFNFKTWKEKVVDVMAAMDHENWFCGEVNDQNIKFDSNLVFFSAAASAHTAVIGMTGSGKTKTLIHICIAAAAAYPKAKWYFGCGKSGADLAPLANRLSEFPLAILDNRSEDTAIQFANIITTVWKEYQDRQKAWMKARELGYNPSTYLELRTIAIEKNLPELYFERCYLVIDELKAYWDISCGEASKYVNERDTIPNMINRLLAEGRSYGISVILASQDYKFNTFPTIMRGNLTTQFIHKQETKNCTFVEIPEADQLVRGEYYLKANGLIDKRGATLFKMRMPYIGDDPEKVLDMLGFPVREKREWDYDLLYNRGGGLDFDKIDIISLSKIIRQTFFKREGFEILETYPADERYLSSIIYDPSRDIKIAVGIIKTDDTDIEILQSNLSIEAESHEITDLPKVFFIFGDKTISKWKEVLKIFHSMSAVVIPQNQYSKLLKQAHRLYLMKKSKPIFRPMLDFLIKAQSKDREIQIDKTYGITGDLMGMFKVDESDDVWGSDSRARESLEDENESEETQEDSYEDDIEDVEFVDKGDSDETTPDAGGQTIQEKPEATKKKRKPRSTSFKDKLNISELERIKGIDSTYIKGEEGERFVLELERAINYDTVFMKELIVNKEVGFKPIGGSSDGGVDLIRWVDRAKREAIAIQIKVQTSKKVDTKKLDEFVGAVNKYENLNIVGLVFYNIAGKFTKGCYNYNNVQVIDEDDMKRILSNLKPVNP